VQPRGTKGTLGALRGRSGAVGAVSDPQGTLKQIDVVPGNAL
jgi:hypothetical protein